MPAAKVEGYDIPESVFTLELFKAWLNAKVDAGPMPMATIEDLALVKRDWGEEPVISDAIEQAQELVFRHRREELTEIVDLKVCGFVGHTVPLNEWGRCEAPPMMLDNLREISVKLPAPRPACADLSAT